MEWVGVPVVETVTTAGVSPQNDPSKYTSPPGGLESIKKYPCCPPGSAGSVTGTAWVTGRVEIMAEDAATIAVHNNTMIKTVYDFIDYPPIGMLENAVKNYFNLPLHGNPGYP